MSFLFHEKIRFQAVRVAAYKQTSAYPSPTKAVYGQAIFDREFTENIDHGNCKELKLISDFCSKRTLTICHSSNILAANRQIVFGLKISDSSYVWCRQAGSGEDASLIESSDRSRRTTGFNGQKLLKSVPRGRKFGPLFYDGQSYWMGVIGYYFCEQWNLWNLK